MRGYQTFIGQEFVKEKQRKIEFLQKVQHFKFDHLNQSVILPYDKAPENENEKDRLKRTEILTIISKINNAIYSNSIFDFLQQIIAFEALVPDDENAVFQVFRKIINEENYSIATNKNKLSSKMGKYEQNLRVLLPVVFDNETLLDDSINSCALTREKILLSAVDSFREFHLPKKEPDTEIKEEDFDEPISGQKTIEKPNNVDMISSESKKEFRDRSTFDVALCVENSEEKIISIVEENELEKIKNIIRQRLEEVEKIIEQERVTYLPKNVLEGLLTKKNVHELQSSLLIYVDNNDFAKKLYTQIAAISCSCEIKKQANFLRQKVVEKQNKSGLSPVVQLLSNKAKKLEKDAEAIASNIDKITKEELKQKVESSYNSLNTSLPDEELTSVLKQAKQGLFAKLEFWFAKISLKCSLFFGDAGKILKQAQNTKKIQFSL